MNKKVYKSEFADTLINFLISRYSYSYINEWPGEKYFRNDENFNPLKIFSTDNPVNVNGIEEISGFKSDNIYFKSTGKQIDEGIKQLSDEPPEHCSLYQNSPNPFCKKTIINFQSSSHCFVSLKIYDSTFKEISTLVFKKAVPGTYQAEFDGSSLPSGVYFCRLTAGEFTDTKRMILLK